MTTKKTLHISDDLQLPYSAVTATQVIYGGKGMGKTNYGAVFIEELSRASMRWSLIDPMGVAYGLRYAADGKGAGVACLILGGAHGDIPIEPTGGAVVADLVADHDVSVIIDISRKANGEMWGIGERIRFVADYGRQLFKRQGSLVDGKRREPICQVIDEAARFIPQMIRSGDVDVAKCSGVWSAIVEEGRNIGLGVVLLTQRSARLNKDVAELADLMLAFRTVGPNSIEAVMDWLGAHVAKDRLNGMREAVRSLPVGSALAVSPGWLGEEKVIAIRRRQTFDSSATPKPGEQAVRVKGEGAKPDLAVYAARMAETIERAKQDDPRALRAKIAELEAAAKKAGAARTVEAAAPVTMKVPQVVKAAPALSAEERETIAMLKQTFDALGTEIEAVLVREKRDKARLGLLRGLTQQLTRALAAEDGELAAPSGLETMRRDLRALRPKLDRLAAKVTNVASEDPPRSEAVRPANVVPNPPAVPRAQAEGSPAHRILHALARFRAAGVDAPPRLQICLLSGYGNLKSAGFAKAMGQLKTSGMIEYPDSETLRLTHAGVESAPDAPALTGDEELQALIYDIMGYMRPRRWSWWKARESDCAEA